MLYLVGQIFFCLALMAMVGLLVGWLLRGIGTRQREQELEATWRMRLRQRDSMLSKMATELAERDASDAPSSAREASAELSELRQALQESNARLAQVQGRVSKRDAQISQLFTELRRSGGQAAVQEILAQVNQDSFLASGMHKAAELRPAPPSEAKAQEPDPSERTYPEKASLQSASQMAPGEQDEQDDLDFIYGISPALQKKLFKIGITTYRQIAGFDGADIERIAKAIGIDTQQINDENWVEGARQEHLAKYGELL